MESIDKTFKFLLYSRAFRSIGIIYMTLALPLYLSAMNINIINIGIIFAAVLFFMVITAIVYGEIGDRIGFRYELIIAEFLAFSAALIIFLSTNIYIIIIAMIIGGIGGGAGGLRGAFSPGTNAIIASNYPDAKDRIKRYGQIIAIGSGMSIFGSLLLSMHSFISGFIGVLFAFRILFLVAALFLLISFICLLFVKEEKRPRKTTKLMKNTSLKYMSKIIVANSLGGIGMGIAIPLLPLWLEIAYNANSLTIGIIFGISYIAISLGSYLSSRIGSNFNILNTASYSRIISGVALLLMGISPFLVLAAIFFIIRTFIAGFGSPARNTVNVKGIDVEDFGTASSVQGIATRFSQLSSGLSGYLIDYSIPLPLEIGGVFQILSGFVYKYLLKDHKKL